MPRLIPCLVLMSVGPDSSPEHVRDTVDSFRHSVAPDETALLVLDDTGGDAVAERLPDTHDVTRLVADDPPRARSPSTRPPSGSSSRSRRRRSRPLPTRTTGAP